MLLVVSTISISAKITITVPITASSSTINYYPKFEAASASARDIKNTNAISALKASDAIKPATSICLHC
jgi:hypothetical protein